MTVTVNFKSEPEKVSLGALKQGDTWVEAGRLFIVLSLVKCEGSVFINVVELKGGHTFTLPTSRLVEPVDIEINVL